jgi:hypothetical protein
VIPNPRGKTAGEAPGRATSQSFSRAVHQAIKIPPQRHPQTPGNTNFFTFTAFDAFSDTHFVWSCALGAAAAHDLTAQIAPDKWLAAALSV